MSEQTKAWSPSFMRIHFFYEVWQRQWSDFAGSAYKAARNSWGFRKRFLTYKGAQDYADKLNAETTKETP